MNFDSLFKFNKGLTLERLRSLVLVADAGTIMKAAPDQTAKQSQFIRQIGELESFFCVPLRSKDNSKSYLNAEGVQLANLSRRALQDLEAFQHAVLKKEPEISIGTGDSLLRWLVLPNMPELQSRMPHSNWMVHDLQNMDTCSRLINGSIDFGLLRSDLVKPSLGSEPIGTIRYRLFVPAKLLAKPQKANLQELLEDLPIATQGNDTLFRRVLEESVASHGWKLNTKLLGESFTQVASGLDTGCFAAILPHIAAQQVDKDVVWSVSLKKLGKLDRTIHLAWNPKFRKARPHLELAENVLRQLLKFR